MFKIRILVPTVSFLIHWMLLVAHVRLPVKTPAKHVGVLKKNAKLASKASISRRRNACNVIQTVNSAKEPIIIVLHVPRDIS